MVDCLHFPHFDEPHSDGLGCSLQDPLPVVLSLVKYLWEQTSTQAAWLPSWTKCFYLNL